MMHFKLDHAVPPMPSQNPKGQPLGEARAMVLSPSAKQAQALVRAYLEEKDDFALPESLRPSARLREVSASELHQDSSAMHLQSLLAMLSFYWQVMVPTVACEAIMVMRVNRDEQKFRVLIQGTEEGKTRGYERVHDFTDSTVYPVLEELTEFGKLF